MRDCSKLACYFPTTIMLIDDNLPFIKAIRENLPKDIVNIVHADPEKALKEIRSKERKNRNFTDVASDGITEERTRQPDDINQVINPLIKIVPHVYETIYDTKRFDRITVVIVDYNMPKMNGLEFCQKLKKTKIKKILLVTSAEYQIAEQAFKKGIIDYFIPKTSYELCSELNKTIRRLQIEYFRDLSKELLNHLPLAGASTFADSIYGELFSNICHTTHNSEFYLIDSIGSFLLLDFSGSPLWFITRTEQIMQDFHNVALANQASPRLIQDIENRAKVPFFFTEAACRKSIIDWDKYSYQSEKFAGEKNNYFYALITDRSMGNLNYEKILSHRAYLEKLNIVL